MSYTLPLPCGCTAYVSCWPDTGVAHTRVIEFGGVLDEGSIRTLDEVLGDIRQRSLTSGVSVRR